MGIFSSGSKKRRFDIYNVTGDLSNPELSGVIHSKAELDYGTPNLSRSENITLFGSNVATKETLLVKLKWRPVESTGMVTLVSSVHFSLSDEMAFESKEVETYEPEQVLVYTQQAGPSKRILQIGSRASKLRLYINSPYRRMRLVFMGQVKNRRDNSTAFLRLSLIFNATGKIFDFLDEFDEQCARQIYQAKKEPKPVRTYEEYLKDLLLHDRHDQKCRFKGEYLLKFPNGQEAGSRQVIKKEISIWGFHCRHYLGAASQTRAIKTKRIYSHMINGQAYLLANNRLDSDEIDFGFTSFSTMPFTEPISKPFEGVDWQKQVDENMEKFELVVSGQGQTFVSKTVAKRGLNIKPHEDKYLWFDVDTNETPGFAWVSLDDELIDSQTEMEIIEKSRNTVELALENGCLARKSGAREVDEKTRGRMILCLNEQECCDSALVGSKASSLAHLMRLQSVLEARNEENRPKFKVPFGFATTKMAYDLLIGENQSLKETIEKLEEEVGQGESDDLAEKCANLVALVKELKLPDLFKEQVREKLDAHYKHASGQPSFAVRSSSWGEDEEGMSAAGQLTTILNVPNEFEKVCQAIIDCYASKFSFENIEYKRQRGLRFNMPMSVVIQEMISCDKAGVLFTCDPTIGDPNVITITANYGLGESVVSGAADPDSIRVLVDEDGSGWKFNIEEINVGKKLDIVGSKNNEGKDYDRSISCLSEEEIIQLSRCAMEVRKYFWSRPCDIEWGIWQERSESGPPVTSLYLFQSRPVTGTEKMSEPEFLDEVSRASPSELGFFTRANIGEVMPYPVTPYSLTYAVYSWNVVGARLWFNLADHRRPYVPQCTTDVYYEKYHALFSLRCSSILQLGGAPSVLAKAMEIGLFGREMGPQPELEKGSRGFTRPPNIWEGPRFQWLFKKLIWTPFRAVNGVRANLQKLRKQVFNGELIKSKPGEPARLVELYEQLGYLMNYLEQAWTNHIANITLNSKQNVALTAFLSKYIQDPMRLTSAANKFLAISPDVVSAEIPRRVEEMAQIIMEKGREEMEKFTGSISDEEALEYCRSTGGDALREKFEEFIGLFGHRCYNEFELSGKSWRMDPIKIVDMIRINCTAKLHTSKEDQNEQSTGSQGKLKTIDDVIESLPDLRDNLSFTDRMALKYFIAPKSQLLLAIREQTKDILVFYTDTCREATIQIARELRRQLRLPDLDLMFYLTLDEVQQLVHAEQPGLVMLASCRRQMFKRIFGGCLWKFDEIFSEIVPNHLKERNQEERKLEEEGAAKLHGTPASSGKVRGKVCLVDGYKDLKKIKAGTILLTHSTDIGFSPVFPLILGIITEVGGLISHGAVVAREYGLPSVIGIPNVTKIIADGEEIILDADNGTIVRLDKS